MIKNTDKGSGAELLRLREERQKRGLSQTKLSALTGIASSDISAIENRWKRPFPGWKKRISKALNMSGPDAERLFEEVAENDR